VTVPLHRREDGPVGAPPLVLLTSLGTSAQMWEPVVGPLAEWYRVTTVDTRGHGDSAPAPAGARPGIADLAHDVLAVLDEQRLRRVDLAGISLGGMVGMWIAAHHPARVRRLALLSTSAHLPPSRSWLERAQTVRAGGMAAIAEPVTARWITPALARRDPELMRGLQAMLTAVDPESYAQCCEALAAMDLRPDLPRIAAPTLVVAGADDRARSLPRRRDARRRPHHPARRARRRPRRPVAGRHHPVHRVVPAVHHRYARGEIWTRPALTHRDRSIATLAALVATGAEQELGLHVRAGLRNGLSGEEIAEVLLHTAVYAGVPRANRAFAIAPQVLAEDAQTGS
jgi:3-oxoadipate enol-lactonase/4-carboxymuconolactone decarboxylase